MSVPAEFNYADKLDNDMLGWELYTMKQSRDTSFDGVLPKYDSKSIYIGKLRLYNLVQKYLKMA